MLSMFISSFFFLGVWDSVFFTKDEISLDKMVRDEYNERMNITWKKGTNSLDYILKTPCNPANE